MESVGAEAPNMGEREFKSCDRDGVSHLSLDIGGSLIKMVYFSSGSSSSSDDKKDSYLKDGTNTSIGTSNHNGLRGKLHFLKFETSKIDECIKFISSKHLQNNGGQGDKDLASEEIIIKATGGGAFKFADLFKEKLGIVLDKVDEMSCLVAGANFLLKAVNHEAFTYMDDQKDYVQINHKDLYPYLLVTVGSGVSMIKVDGDNNFERVSGTSVGGGTFWGLGRLLTKCQSFDELLELSRQGNNRVIDMLVGDIYGGTDYSKIGLTSTTIASSFGKAISANKELDDYRPEDVARSLLRMISNNIGQIAYLNALRFGLKRIFFGGFFIRGHAYTMDTLSVAVNFWSKGEAKALFLRHEGFLGALGAFMNYKKNGFTDITHQFMEQSCEIGQDLVCKDEDI
ncbi:pantothenate kinase 1-like isoform X1 [Salvia hispanica]|uniref:pantothenate kinase 1-like isoform X1 n=1 Tax=Salvia hispanica TaxID=49212 RepID=UPI002009BBB5|nr:pantothenate kinase 1-like isoform X1 [Salvia hispanica]